VIEDRVKWDERYKKEKDIPKEPSLIVTKYYKYAKIKKALDIACGIGRNSKFLAKKGFSVDAVDISDIALKNIKNIKNITPILADLDQYNIKKDFYDLIICINYLNRELFNQIKDGLKNQGVLIYESLVYNKRLSSNMNKRYLLEKNELLHQFIDFEILYYEEKEIKNIKNELVYKAYLVCRKINCK